MKLPKRKSFDPPDTQSSQATAEMIPLPDSQALPAVVATAYTRVRLGQRVRMLRRLLLPVGPMALTVLGGGALPLTLLERRVDQWIAGQKAKAVVAAK